MLVSHNKDLSIIHLVMFSKGIYKSHIRTANIFTNVDEKRVKLLDMVSCDI